MEKLQPNRAQGKRKSELVSFQYGYDDSGRLVITVECSSIQGTQVFLRQTDL